VECQHNGEYVRVNEKKITFINMASIKITCAVCVCVWWRDARTDDDGSRRERESENHSSGMWSSDREQQE